MGYFFMSGLFFSCDGYIDSNPAAQRTVTLSDLRYVLWILGFGLFCATLTFLLEMFVKKLFPNSVFVPKWVADKLEHEKT